MKTTKQVNVSLSLLTAEKLKRISQKDNIAISRLVEDLINERYYKMQFVDGVNWAPIHIEGESASDDDLIIGTVPKIGDKVDDFLVRGWDTTPVSTVDANFVSKVLYDEIDHGDGTIEIKYPENVKPV